MTILRATSEARKYFRRPILREIDERIWFKLKLDDKRKWRPAPWQSPALEEHPTRLTLPSSSEAVVLECGGRAGTTL
jgi:hypothetical protein